VAMTRHGRGGSPLLALGCTAGAVVLNARTSVLLVPGGTPPRWEEAPEVATCTRILVPVDCSPRSDWSVRVATVFAQGTDATLRVIHVLDTPEVINRLPAPGPAAEAVSRILESNRLEAEAYLHSLEARLEATGVRAKTQIHGPADGDAAEALRALVGSEPPDLVVLGAHGKGGSTHWPFGGLTSKLVLWCESPVLVLQDLHAAVPRAPGEPQPDRGTDPEPPG
jgi:nucleotide-binding universal stress UspA family protein